VMGGSLGRGGIGGSFVGGGSLLLCLSFLRGVFEV